MSDSQSARNTRPSLSLGTQPIVEVPAPPGKDRRIPPWLIAAGAGILAGAVTALTLWLTASR